jgi:hypothetical protein
MEALPGLGEPAPGFGAVSSIINHSGSCVVLDVMEYEHFSQKHRNMLVHEEIMGETLSSVY